MLKKEEKKNIMKEFGKHENDTGSIEVQIGILTKEIKELTEHLKKHKHDFSSRRGLLRKVAKRRKLLRYLQQTDPSAYEKILKKIK
jgi:small subunit ribosomal protein S15